MNYSGARHADRSVHARVRSSGQLDSKFTASDGPLLCLLREARTRLSSPINSAGFSLFVLCAASTDTSNLRVSAELRG